MKSMPPSPHCNSASSWRMRSSPAPRVRSSIPRRLQALAQRMRALAGTEQPNSITRALIRVARSKDIPVCSFAPGTRIWMYGQGAQAFRFSESISEHESFLGVRLVRDKILTRSPHPSAWSSRRRIRRRRNGRDGKKYCASPRLSGGGQALRPRQGGRHNARHRQ